MHVFPKRALYGLGAGVMLAASVHAGNAPLVLRQHYVPKDLETGRYQYVPFEVPAGTTRVEIEYRYDKAGGRNVIDLGLYEPGPLDRGTPALRGWTGGEYARISVGVSSATPGYWAGPLPPGRWHVQLGLYKVAPEGVDVEVHVTLSSAPEEPAPPLPARPAEPLRRGPAWYAGALHTHTLHSDGRLTPQELARKAKEEGLDFLAITDHNNTVHQRDAPEVPGLLHIVGEELTTPGGHANVWGLGGERDHVDFRALPGDPTVQQWVDAVHARGALVAVNHPFAECFACAWTHAVPEGLDALEISSRDGAETSRAIALWDVLLRQGRRVTAVGTSDWHRGEAPVGRAGVRVYAEELSTRAVLDAIRAGRVVVMGDARLPPPELRLRADGREATLGGTLALRAGTPIEIEVAAGGPAYAGARVDLYWRGERVAGATASGTAPLRFTRHATADGYYRVHVHAADGAPLAVTNPVFVTVERP